jgi:hypothetical protein
VTDKTTREDAVDAVTDAASDTEEQTVDLRFDAPTTVCQKSEMREALERTERKREVLHAEMKRWGRNAPNRSHASAKRWPTKWSAQQPRRYDCSGRGR